MNRTLINLENSQQWKTIIRRLENIESYLEDIYLK